MAVYLSHILPVVESDSYIDNNVFISLQMPTFQYWKSQAMINESIFILVFFFARKIFMKFHPPQIIAHLKNTKFRNIIESYSKKIQFYKVENIELLFTRVRGFNNKNCSYWSFLVGKNFSLLHINIYFIPVLTGFKK